MSLISKIKSVFSKFFQSEPQWNHLVSSFVKLASPITVAIIQATAGEAAAADVRNAIGQVQTDLAMIDSVVSSTGGSASLPLLLSSVTQNLSGILQAGHIKNPTTQSQVTTWVNLITGEAEALVSELPQFPGPAVPAPAKS